MVSDSLEKLAFRTEIVIGAKHRSRTFVLGAASVLYRKAACDCPGLTV